MLFSVDSTQKNHKSHLFVGRAKLSSQLISDHQLLLPYLSSKPRLTGCSWISNTGLFSNWLHHQELFIELITHIVPPCTKWLTNLPACPVPHRKCHMPKTGSEIAESSIISQRPCGGRNLPTVCHMVVEWPIPYYTASAHKISNWTVHSADSKQHMTVFTLTQKVNKKLW